MNCAKLTSLALCAVLLCACSKGAPADPAAPKPDASAASVASIPSPVSPRAGVHPLMARQETKLTYTLRDSGKPAATVNEETIIDGNRVVHAYEGKVYVTWHVAPEGVYRRDPKGGGALLRYLPAELKDGLAWSQQSGDAQVWFHLRKAGQNWELLILNRGELTRFLFVEGMGPIMAVTENWARPADSFAKWKGEDKGESPSKESRATYLGQAEAALTEKAPGVQDASADEFFRQVNTAMKSFLTKAKEYWTDVDGDGVMDLVRGQFYDWTNDPFQVLYWGQKPLDHEASNPRGKSQRLTPLYVPGSSRPIFVREYRGTTPANTVTTMEIIYGYRENASTRLLTYTPSNADGIQLIGQRTSVSENGVIRLERELGDPAAHMTISAYQVIPDATSFRLRRVENETKMVPQGKELLVPQTADKVLLAAIFAKDRAREELPHYFLGSNTVETFEGESRLHLSADWMLPQVQVGRLGEPKSGEMIPTIAEDKQASTGTFHFLVKMYDRNGYQLTWGSITLIAVQGAGPVIQRFEVTGTGRMPFEK